MHHILFSKYYKIYTQNNNCIRLIEKYLKINLIFVQKQRIYFEISSFNIIVYKKTNIFKMSFADDFRFYCLNNVHI